MENLFHLVRKQLNRDAISKNIVKESYEEFQNRIVSFVGVLCDMDILQVHPNDQLHGFKRWAVMERHHNRCSSSSP